MSTERELLEAAARAVGLRILDVHEEWPDDCTGWVHLNATGLLQPLDRSKWMPAWNPRHFKEQSMDLMAALRISVEHNHPQDHEPWVSASVERIGAEGVCMGVECFMEDVPDEAQRADRMRLAILRCAAAQAPKPVGTGGPENGPEIAETRMDTGFRRGPGDAADLVLLEGGEACPS